MKKTLAAIFMASALFVEADTFQTSQFSLTLPDSWVEIPKEVLDAYSEQLAQLAPDNPKQVYDYGYQYHDPEGWFRYPYILVQIKNVGRISSGELGQYKKIRKGLDEGVDDVETNLSGILSNASIGEPIHDEENQILWTTMSMDVNSVGRINAITALKLTEQGFIQFNAYATEATFNKCADVYRTAFSGLHINASIAYKPQVTDNAPSIGGVNMGKVAIAGLKGALIGGIIGLFSWIKKKRKNS